MTTKRKRIKFNLKLLNKAQNIAESETGRSNSLNGWIVQKVLNSIRDYEGRLKKLDGKFKHKDLRERTSIRIKQTNKQRIISFNNSKVKLIELDDTIFNKACHLAIIKLGRSGTFDEWINKKISDIVEKYENKYGKISSKVIPSKAGRPT